VSRHAVTNQLNIIFTGIITKREDSTIMIGGEMAANVFEEFKWRGLLFDHTEDAEEILSNQKITAYIGFDPTADSLHVGSLVPIMGLVHLQRHGHTPIALIGGGTGMIGDPSGKTKERQLLTIEQLDINLVGIRAQLERFLDFEGVENPAVMDNNANWLLNLNLIDFLRDTGKHFTVNYMMAKDSVKSRLSSDEGISYTEFTYMLLQAYDFAALYDRYGCTFQMGGSDQWGNITAGTQLIRKTREAQAQGIVYPLVTTASGVKFGKTEAGTVWLDAKRTSPYRFYQFWINVDDSDVVPYLKIFTLLEQDEIAELEKVHEAEAWKRDAHRRLAEEVTRMVHGEDALARAQAATDVLFGDGAMTDFSSEELIEIFEEVPSTALDASQLVGEGIALVDIVQTAGFESSKGRSRQLISDGGVYVNGERIEDTDKTLTTADAIEGQVIVLRKGRKKYHLLKVE